MILKIEEVIAYLYKLSERQVEVFVNENLTAKYFVGLAVDEKAPDHSTLTTFRERLLKNGKVKVFEELLTQIVQEALLRGVKFGSIQIIDSVHTITDVNPDKDKNRKNKGKCPMTQMPKGGYNTSIKSRMKKAKKSNKPSTFTGIQFM